MRHLLSFAIGVLVLSPAFATEYFGGTLQVAEVVAIDGTPKELRTAVATTEYSNVTTFLGQGVTNGGAAVVSGNTITRLVADDITPTGVNSGRDVVQFKFSVVNLNTMTVTSRPRVRFWFANGAGGGPGTYYNLPVNVGFTFNPITMNPGTMTVFFTNLAAGAFTMPAATFWAGMTFDNNSGTTGATAAQLNNMGQGVFNPPAVGTSADVFFTTTAAGSFFPTSNPAGTLGNFGGNPPANLGWEFTVDVPVPVEGGSWSTIKQMYR